MYLNTKLRQLTLFLLVSVTASDEGCGKDGWRCGDTCIAGTESCMCGGTEIVISSSSWCCGTGCADGSCPSPAREIPLTQSCKGRCNNHTGDVNRNYWAVRSHVHMPCEGICAPEQVCEEWDTDRTVCQRHVSSLCTGGPPLCPYGQDIKQCNAGGDHHACDTVHWHAQSYSKHCRKGQCISDKLINNGVYDCAHRNDEETSFVKMEESVERNANDDDHPLGEPCVDGFFPGITCNGSCLAVSALCDPDQAGKLSEECQIGDRLCYNQTFFRQHREFWERETPDMTVCGGILPGQMVSTGESYAII